MAISDERLTTRSASVGRLQAKRLLSVASREVNRGRVALRESAQLKTTADEQCAADGVARQGGQRQNLRRRSRAGSPILATAAKANNTALGPRGRLKYIWNTSEEKVSPTRRDKSTRDADKGPHLRRHSRRELLFAALSHSSHSTTPTWVPESRVQSPEPL